MQHGKNHTSPYAAQPDYALCIMNYALTNYRLTPLNFRRSSLGVQPRCFFT